MKLLILAAAFHVTAAFPNGAPIDTCVKKTPNRPHHGTAEPQPPSANPYTVVASGSSYQPGTRISVTIRGDQFRGFFFQARDASTGYWIGEFEASPNTSILPECSAVTHADPKDKIQATLVWRAPAQGQGHVYFTGTVLRDYTTFWTNVVADLGQK